jgi:nucleotide-binding universal stress UspA family protein
VYKKIIVGIDFSDKTERAVQAALSLAKATGGTVVLVHVLPASADGQRSAPGSETEMTRTIEQRLQEQAQQLTASTGVSVDYGVCEGEVVEEMRGITDDAPEAPWIVRPEDLVRPVFKRPEGRSG